MLSTTVASVLEHNFINSMRNSPVKALLSPGGLSDFGPSSGGGGGLIERELS